MTAFLLSPERAKTGHLLGRQKAEIVPTCRERNRLSEECRAPPTSPHLFFPLLLNACCFFLSFSKNSWFYLTKGTFSFFM